jgi:hypothetical protein
MRKMSWHTDLEAYAHYWGSALGKSQDRAKRQMRDIRADVDGTWGKADDPLGAHTPMAQNAILKRLGKLAAGRIDDWESLVDPTLSPGENYAIILDNGGELPADEKEEIRQAIANTVDAREQSRAADILRKNVEAIDAGEKQQLVDDISAEYGREFVDETLRYARIDAGLIDDDGADDETPIVSPNTDDVDETPAPADAETPDVDDVETTDEITADATTSAEKTDETTAETPTTATTAETKREPEGRAGGTVRGLLRAMYAAVKVPFEQGRQDALSSDGQQTLSDY